MNGSASERLGNRNGRLYSMNGDKRISVTELHEVSVMHLLLFEPAVETRGGGSALETKCLGAVETFTWKLGNYKNGPFDLTEPHLTVAFDGETNTVKIAGRSYDASQGNLFAVWLDPKWEAIVKQLESTVIHREPLAEVLEEFKRSLPLESDVQAAKLHSQVPSAKPAG